MQCGELSTRSTATGEVNQISIVIAAGDLLRNFDSKLSPHEVEGRQSLNCHGRRNRIISQHLSDMMLDLRSDYTKTRPPGPSGQHIPG